MLMQHTQVYAVIVKMSQGPHPDISCFQPAGANATACQCNVVAYNLMVCAFVVSPFYNI